MDKQSNPTQPTDMASIGRQSHSATPDAANQGQQLANIAEVTEQLPDVETAEQLDREIRQFVRDFVDLGAKLIEMRDGQYYRHLPQNFVTFEDYCKSVQGLSLTDARRKIKASLIYRAIEDSGVRCRTPETLAQVEAIQPLVVFQESKRIVTTASGAKRTIGQPIGIKNPEKLVAQWKDTVRAFESDTRRAEEGRKRRPVLSAKYVRNKLPDEFKQTVDRRFDCNPVISTKNSVAKLAAAIEKQRFVDPACITKVMQQEPKAEAYDLDDLTRECSRLAETLAAVVGTIKEIQNGN